MSDIDARTVLLDSYDRIAQLYPHVLDGLSADDLRWRADDEANPIAWLLWHAARVQDDHLSGVATALGTPRPQAWDTWAPRFDLPYEHDDIGYGHTAEQVARFDLDDPDLLLGYHAAVHELTVAVLGDITPQNLATIVDRSFDPPVTAAARLVSVVGDAVAHLGQADYVAGIRRRARG